MNRAKAGISKILSEVELQPNEVTASIFITEIDGEIYLRIVTLKEAQVGDKTEILLSRTLQGVSISDIL